MIRIIFLAFFSVCTALLVAQSPEKVAQVIREAVEEERLEQNIHGVAIGVIKNGRTIHTGAYGFADLLHEEPLTTETVMNWASISKTFTAVMAWQLIEDKMGNLNRDDKVGPIVPNWPPAKDPEYNEKYNITIGDLMSHRSRISDTSEDEEVAYKPAANTDWDAYASVEVFKNRPLLDAMSVPSYSNSAYNLLGAVIDARGPGYFQQATNIAKALRLESLSISKEPTDGWGRYCSDPRVHTTWDQTDILPAGGWQSNVKDLTTLAKNIFWGDRLLDNAAAMWEDIPNNRRFRYGIYDEEQTAADGSKIQLIGHGGGQGNVRNYMGYLPEYDLAIVLLTNTRGIDIYRLYRQVALALGVPFAAEDDYQQNACESFELNSESCDADAFTTLWGSSSNQRLLRRGYPRTTFYKELDELRDLGYQCMDVEVRTDNSGDTWWDGVFTRSDNRHRFNSNMTFGRMETQVASRKQSGFYPVDIEAYEENGQLRWVAVFKRGNGETELRLTPSGLVRKNEQMLAEGYRLHELEPYVEGGKRYFAAVWRLGTASKFIVNLSKEQLDRNNANFAADGFKLASIEPYLTTTKRLRFAAIWWPGGAEKELSTTDYCEFSQRYNSHQQQIADFERLFGWAPEL